MNGIDNKFLLTGGKSMPKLYLRQPWFTCSACGSLTNHCKRIQKFKETSDLNYIYKNGIRQSFFCSWGW